MERVAGKNRFDSEHAGVGALSRAALASMDSTISAMRARQQVRCG